jgi:putative SOS response-associated peptidase YedK
LAFIHDRQPVVVTRDEGHRWLDRTQDPLALHRDLLRPRIATALSLVPVSTYVNNSRNEGERCIEPIGRSIEVGVQA